MALNFPNNPSLNDSYQFGGIKYEWDGSVWNIVTAGLTGVNTGANLQNQIDTLDSRVDSIDANGVGAVGGGLDSTAVQSIIDSNTFGGLDSAQVLAITLDSAAVQGIVDSNALTAGLDSAAVQSIIDSNNIGGLDSAQVIALAGADSGGGIENKLDSSLGHTNWKGSFARKARYWSVRDLNNQCDLRELYFVDENGDRLTGTPTASSQTSFQQAPGAQDNDPATRWETAAAASGDAWYAMDFGSEVTVAEIGFLPDTTNPPSNDWGLYWSDDGSNWNLIYRANYGGTYTNNVRVDFDVSADVQGTTAYDELVLGLDFHFGNTNWRSGGADIIQPTADSLDAGDNGKTLVWDNTEGKFVISSGTSGSLLLGGGVEVISEFDLSGADSAGFDVNDLNDSISNYDEIHILVYGADKRMDLELSDDNGVSTQNIIKYFDNGGTASSHTQMEFGATGDGADTLAQVVVKYHNLIGVRTAAEAFGSEPGGVSQHSGAIATTEAVTTGIIVAPTSGSFTTGKAYVIGYKKSRQPIEISGRLSSPWTANATVTEYITTGVKFRAGNIGKVRLNQIPGQSIVVNVEDDSGTVFATGTVDSASDSADISADSDFTIRDAVTLKSVDSAGLATRIDMIVRGEFT